ncbi:uncharacterized protein LOC124814655 [Hydra vulgaris]|uniref:uncharacterized protein LOC124814655 n=1 Tax=Hydra vulgaris TaxID=6087 RepID=UPI0032E9E459
MGPKKKALIFGGEINTFLNAKYKLFNDTNIKCRNGHVLFVFIKSGEIYTKTVKEVNEHFNFNTSTYHVQSVVNVAKKWKHNFKRDCTHFVNFCNKLFTCYPTISTMTQPSQSSPSNSHLVALSYKHDSLSSETHNEFLPTASCSNHVQDIFTCRQEIPPRENLLKIQLSNLANQLATSSKKYRTNIAIVKSKLNSMPYKLKLSRQSVKRKEDVIKDLRRELRELKTKMKISYYTRQIRNHTATIKKLKYNEKQKLKQIKVKHNTDNRANKKMIASLENNLLQKEENATTLLNMNEEAKTYLLHMRMIIYNMLICNVPTGNIPFLIQKIGQCMGFIFSDIPHRNSIEQMARELGSISSLQAAEWAINNSQLTLGFDATTQKGVHINSIHLTSKDKCLVIALDQLPGGTADDYENHICNAIDHMAFIYSHFHSCSYNESRSSIIANISNTMSDRVAVNHLTISKVCATWGKSLNELNCHLHPLDTIATSCRSALKSLENEKCKLFGNDCMATLIILAINKMRFKDVKGDPQGFINFLDNNDLPRGIIPRYRGNRLHILFHTCFILIKHHSKFKQYLTVGTVKCKSLQATLRTVFCSATAIKQLCVLAVFGKLLTGPWMKKFYVISEQATFDHVAGIQVVKNVIQTVQTCKSNPAGLFCRKTDFFDQPLEPNILESVTSLCSVDEELLKMTLACLIAVEDVLNRQYSRYFSLTVTETFKEETASARLHNIDSEELMGMFSDAKVRAPNATICYISCKLRSKKNRTVDYLDTLDLSLREKIVKWSISVARKNRFTNRLHLCKVRDEICQRQKIKRQKMDEKEKRKLERELSKLNFEEIVNSYKHLSNDQLFDLEEIMSDRIVGKKLEHEWYDPKTCKSVLYNGRVEKVNKRKNDFIYTISYWKDDETDIEAVDYCMKKIQLAADVVSVNQTTIKHYMKDLKMDATLM